MASSGRVPYYHYTNGEGLAGILGDGRIVPSDPKYGDAREGRGTYGTNLPPSTRAKAIAKNNWDGGWQTAMEHGKLDHYIRCEVPADELRQVPGHGRLRSGKVLVHPQGIDLEKYPTKYGAVGQDRVPHATRYNAKPMGSYNPGLHASASTPIKTPSRLNNSSAGFAASPPKLPKPMAQPKLVETKKVPSTYSRLPTGPGLLCPYPVSKASQVSFAEPSDDEAVPCYISREIESSGYNSQGNYYESYSDGSYHYENQNGSTYDCDEDGHATYTSPDGCTVEYDADDNDNCGYDGGYDDAGGYDNAGDNSYGGCSDGDWDDGGYSDGS